MGSLVDPAAAAKGVKIGIKASTEALELAVEQRKIESAVSKARAEAQAANSPSISFGHVENQASHTFRHVEAAGFDRTVFQNAATADLSKMGVSLPTYPYNGFIIVNGAILYYAAFRLPDGTLNIGRISPPR